MLQKDSIFLKSFVVNKSNLTINDKYVIINFVFFIKIYYKHSHLILNLLKL